MRKIYLSLITVLGFSGMTMAQGNNCASATAVTPGGYTVPNIPQGTTSGIGGGAGSYDAVWYSFTAPCNGTIDVNSCLGGADTRLYIHDGTSGCPTGGSIANNDDFCPTTSTGPNFASSVSNVPVTAGTTYYIEWDDRWMGAGTPSFNWTLDYTPAGVTNVTSTPGVLDAMVDWDPEGAETDWTLEYGPSGFTPGSGTTWVITTASDTVIDGLNPETTYDFYIMAGAGPCNLGPFSFTTLPLCSPPTAPMSTPGTDNANLTWTPGGLELMWDVEWGFDGFLLGTGTQDFGLVANNDPLVGLSSNTDYDWYVRAVCDVSAPYDTVSVWVGPEHFATQQICADPSALGTSNDNGFDVDLGWTAGGLEAEWNLQWGLSGFTLNGAGSNAETGIATNPFDLNGITPETDYCFYVQSVCGSTPDSVSNWVGPFCWTSATYCNVPSGLGISNLSTTSVDVDWTAGGAETDWTIEYGMNGFALGSGTQMAVSGTPMASLTGLTSNTDYCYYVQSNCGSTADSSSQWAGPFCFSTLPSCVNPSSLGAINITNTAANLLWQVNGTESMWDVEWGMPGFTPGAGEEAGSVTGTVDNPYYATGLNESAPYEFYVRADCGGGDMSDWVGPYYFETLLVNDQPCDAIKVIVDDPMIQHYSAGATADAGEPTPGIIATCTDQNGWCVGGTSTTVWFQFNAPASGAVEITTFDEMMMYNTDYTNMAVYSTPDCNVYGAYVEVAANTLDPGAFGPPYGSTITLCALTPGEDYYIMIDGAAGFTAPTFGIMVTSLDPAISAGTANPLDICENDSAVDLFNAISGNTTTNGQWYNPSVAPGNELGNALDFTGVPAGTYPFFYVDGGACGADTVATSVTVNEGPDAGTGTTITSCNTHDIVLLNGLTGSPQFGGTWSDDDATGRLFNGVFESLGMDAGDYDFTYTVASGNAACPDATATVTVTLTDCMNIEDQESAQLSVYPNPVVSILTIQNLSIDGNATIEITDVQGKVVMSENVTNIYGNYDVDFSNFEDGVYVVKITSETGTQQVRVIKQ